MPTLLISPRYSVDSIALRNAAIAAGWRVERLHTYSPPDSLGEDQPVIYGEGIFAQIIAQSLGLDLIQTSACWLATLPEHYRQRSVECTTLEQARHYPSTAFFKPANEKAFEAQVYESGAVLPVLDEWAEAMPVLICEPVVWAFEFRCFVLNRVPVTISIYKTPGSRAAHRKR